MELPDVAELASSLAGAALRGADAASDEGACAICLDAVDEVDVALVKQCLHAFCTPCIVRWTTFQHDANRRRGVVNRDGAPDTHSTCPCCKARFDSLLVYRDLDGAVSADLREESVCLLRRARWLPATNKDMAWENDFAISAALESFGDFQNAGSAYLDDHLDLYADEEERYMAGRRESRDFRGRNKNAARDRSRPSVVLGNRRFGANGQIATGHRTFARPVGDTNKTATKRVPSWKGAETSNAAGSSSSPDASRGEREAGDRKGKTPASAAAARLFGPGGSSGAAVENGPPVETGTPDRERAAAGAARGKKALKRAEAKAKKEEKEAVRRAKRAENMAASVARAKATRSSPGGGDEGVSGLPDLSDVEDAGECGGEDESGPSEDGAESASASPAPAAPAAATRG